MKCKFCHYEINGDDKYGCPNCMSEGLKSTHGGLRKGAGRKVGSGKGRTVISKTVAMTAESWAILDAVRGTMSRGKFIQSRL